MKETETPQISACSLMSSFDFWLDDMKSGRSMEFSEEAKKNGRVELKNYNNLHEYEIYREFNGLSDIGLNLLEGEM